MQEEMIHEEPEKKVEAELADLGSKNKKVPMLKIVLSSVVILCIVTGIVIFVRYKNSVHNTTKLTTNTQVLITDIIIPESNQLTSLTIEPVKEIMIEVSRKATGKVGFNEDQLTPVFTPYSGRVVEVLVNKGDFVKANQPIITITSPDVIASENDLLEARTNVEKTKIALDAIRISTERARRLHAGEALSTKDLQETEADLAKAEEEYRQAKATQMAASSKLLLFGKVPEEINDGRLDDKVTLRAPIGGTIMDRKVGPGQFVKTDSSDPLFLISNLSTLWVTADIYESDLQFIKLHIPVTIKVAAYPDKLFPAEISFINPTVDPITRTIRVRCLVSNPRGFLKPEMFAEINITSEQKQSVPAIPSNAVVSEGNQIFVFVEESPGHFRRREIVLDTEVQGAVLVKKGINAGEKIVVRGGLLLNELFKSKE